MQDKSDVFAAGDDGVGCDDVERGEAAEGAGERGGAVCEEEGDDGGRGGERGVV